MDLFAAWLLYPLVALAVCTGIGLLAELATGAELPGVLLLPVGMAGLVCSTQLTTYWAWSARLTLPLCLVLAVAGLALGHRRLRAFRPDWWALGTCAAVFAVFAAPVVLSGTATFAGYGVLGDTSIHMIGADALLQHGRDFSSLPPSSYELSLVNYYGGAGYPSGGPTAAGALTSIVHIDIAWTFQPFLTLLVALTAAIIWSLLTPLVASRPLRAALAFIATQPSLVLAYALQGSVKEVGGMWGVLLVAALIPVYLDSRASPRRVVPLALAAAALVGIVGLAAAVWLGPLLIVALVARIVRTRPPPREIVVEVLAFLVLGGVLVYQALLDLGAYTEVAGHIVTAQEEFGNLLGPLDPLHLLGVWLTGDYRLPVTHDKTASGVLSGVVALAFLVGVIGMVWRRAWYLLAFLAVSLFALWYVTSKGSPWADGKAMMIASPAIMFGAVAGAAFLDYVRWRIVAWGLTALLALGVLWSNALQYHDASLAPRDRLEELADIGRQIDGQGPTLYTEFEEFGKHFLRDAAPEGSSEGWQRRFSLAVGRDGNYPRFGYNNDTDQYSDDYLKYYRTIVVPRGFFGSRPPSIYHRIHHGRFYDVWQRNPGAERELLRHVSLGAGRTPSTLAPCGEVRKLARTARAAGGRIASAPLPRTWSFVPAQTAYPRGWYRDPTDGDVLQAYGAGKIEDSIVVPRAGMYTLWVEGSFRRDWRVLVDGKRVDDLRRGIAPRLEARRVATVPLDAGRHVVTLVRPGGTLAPGNGGFDQLGPVVLADAETDSRPAKAVSPVRWRALCDRPSDWVEAVR